MGFFKTHKEIVIPVLIGTVILIMILLIISF